MTNLELILRLIMVSVVVKHADTISSPLQPFSQYKHSIELQENVADLWWTVDENEHAIIFELHINTTGWIALGISPAGGMKNADIGVGWVEQSGEVYFQDRFVNGSSSPVLDSTTKDWFMLEGKEASGWTAIKFRRFLDTCDTMDVPISSGTNNIIFAYGLNDPNPSGPNGEISYHGTRRGSRTIPLRSYANPPSDETFSGLDYFEFRLNKYVIPSSDTTYHCKIYKAPSNYSIKRHAIGHKTLVDPANHDLVHHLLMYECDSTAQFDDNNLPDGPCDRVYREVKPCASNIATGWAVGADYTVAFPKEAGYPVGGNFTIKYYMVQMHYDNPNRDTNRTDSSGIRFYIGKDLRQYDLGYFSLGTDSSAFGIVIPPKVDKFIIDSYCPASATMRFPQSGITVVSTFPHTHLQGRSVWTKLIRNKAAVQYVFNAEAYDFNYQYENRLPKPIKLYPGDELATRCVYNTMNKDKITLGGERTQDEMCLHMMTYYPRMENMYGCVMINDLDAWKSLMNPSASSFDYDEFQHTLLNTSWTPERAVRLQDFYHNASRILVYGASPNLTYLTLPSIPKYVDLKVKPCNRDQGNNETTITGGTIKYTTTHVPSEIKNTTSKQNTIIDTNSTWPSSMQSTTRSFSAAIRQDICVLFYFISIVMTAAFIG